MGTSARAPQVLSRLPSEFYSAEIQRTTVETNTAVVRSLSDLREELLRLRAGVIEVAAKENLGVAAVGTAPRSTYADFELTSTGRYSRMQEQYRLLVDEQLICGTQIHVGVADRDLAVEIGQRIARDLPVLLALSASSPSGTARTPATPASARSSGSGGPAPAPRPAHLRRRVRRAGRRPDQLRRHRRRQDGLLRRPAVLARTHPGAADCDACPLVDDAVLIAGLFRGMARAAELDIEAGRPYVAPLAPLHRAGIWQAARSGLSRQLVDGPAGRDRDPRTTSSAIWSPGCVRSWRSSATGTTVSELTETVLARGNSADRQRRPTPNGAARGRHAARRRGDPRPGRPAHEAPPGSPPVPGPGRRRGPRARIRARARPTAGSSPRSTTLGPPELTGARDHARDDLDRLAGPHLRPGRRGAPVRRRPGPPRHRRARVGGLETGLDAAAWALESFLRDVYGEQRILRDGVLPAGRRPRVPRLAREEATRAGGVVPRPVMGFDIVRNEYGGWRVLEDNVRSPSGAAYAIAARGLMDAVLPDLPRPPGLAHPAAAYELLRSTLLRTPRARHPARRCSPAARSGAWFEHRRLADGAGLLLVLADDLDVTGGRVVHRRRRSHRRPLPAPRRRDDRPDRPRRPADRRRGLRRRDRRRPSWPTRPATASPTTRRPIPSCPSSSSTTSASARCSSGAHVSCTDADEVERPSACSNGSASW